MAPRRPEKTPTPGRRAKDTCEQERLLRPLAERCAVAAFGMGRKTRYDRTVRDALQIKAEGGALSVLHFDPAAAGILEQIRRELAPQVSDALTAELYNLNVYARGCHCVPHKDTPRGSALLGTLVVCLPSRSSPALLGGLIGAAVAGLGVSSGVNWTLVLSSIVIPAILSPIVALIIAACGTYLVFAITAKVPDKAREKGFRWGQIGSASLVSLAHGTGDAQKTMGVIFLALVAHGSLSASGDIPIWVKVSCAVAIALGTYIGGWRVIRTLGKGLVEISSPQGMAAESASAAVILTSSHLGLALSTTHVATGSILGTGVGKQRASVRWNGDGRMAA